MSILDFRLGILDFALPQRIKGGQIKTKDPGEIVCKKTSHGVKVRIDKKTRLVENIVRIRHGFPLINTDFRKVKRKKGVIEK